MIKRGICASAFFLAVTMAVFFSASVLAEDNRSSIDAAFKCLESEIGNKSSLTLEQAIFAGLVLGSEKKIDDRLSSEKDPQECWPKGNCQIKESAQIALVFHRKGGDASKITKWIISKNATPSELEWYLQIDVQDHSPAKCSIEYDSKKGEVEILEDMTLSRNTASDCLSISAKGYWLKIAPGCLGKQFKISCNKDFVSSLIYKKKDSDTVFVSSESHLSSSNSSTAEQVKARCFSKEGVCDYEGTLWAAFVLNKIGKDVNAYIPYLIALAEDNTRYFPSAFLYTLVSKDAGSDEFYNDITQKQNREGFWEISASRYGKYYSSSLAMLAIGAKNIAEVDKFKQSLYKEQNSKGCWADIDPIRDTSFILYAVWNQINKKSGGGGDGGVSEPKCESRAGQSCSVRADCIAAGGEEKGGFSCAGGQICCSKQTVLKSCSEQNGKVCASNQQCSESVVSSLEGSCCLGKCEEVTPITEQNDTCTDSGGECKSSCSSTETEDQSKSCSSEGDLCCISKEGEGGANWLLIILLIILIALVIAGIYYRDKLRVWWYARRGKASASPVIKPGVPPFGGEPKFEPARPASPQRFITPAPPRPSFRPSPQPAQPSALPKRVTSQKDKDVEETLKKLKEMSE